MNDYVKFRIGGYSASLNWDEVGDELAIQESYAHYLKENALSGNDELFEAFETGWFDAIHPAQMLPASEIVLLAAERGIKIGKQYVLDSMRAGDLPYIKNGRQFESPIEDVEKWLSKPGRGNRSK